MGPWSQSPEGFGEPPPILLNRFPVACAWGTYFDIPILRRQCQEYNISYLLSGTAFDVKTLAMLWMGLSGRRTDKLSVEHVANVMGLQPIGPYHGADVDADMEARILNRILSDLSNGAFLDGDLIKLMKAPLTSDA